MEESPKSQRENSNYRPYLAVPGLPILFMFFLIILNFHYINYPYHIVQYNLYRIISTLTAIIFLHYRVAAKMALEILGYTMCRVRV